MARYCNASWITCTWILCLSGLCLIELSSATDRHFFIAAVEVIWDYAPSGQNKVGLDDETCRRCVDVDVSGETGFIRRFVRGFAARPYDKYQKISTRQNEAARIVTGATKKSHEKINIGYSRIGSRYKKAIFKAFTDASFTQAIPSPPWAGLLGPVIRAEVGDTVYVHFKNMASGSNFSVHPHGFLYRKNSEGALYLDFTAGYDKLEDAVPPGAEITYTWYIEKKHAPLPDDDNCVAWAYHSHTLAPRDIHTGLLGILLICKPGSLTLDGFRKDLDRELFVYTDITDENLSWYFEENKKTCLDPLLCHYLHKKKDKKFEESNKKYHVNGYIYGNLPDFPACVGEKIVLYFMSLNLGIHTIHINGQTMVSERRRTDTIKAVAASVYSGYMKPMNPGRWLLYCRNQFHYADGMQAFLNVQQCKKQPSWGPKMNGPVATRRYYIAIEEVLWNYMPTRKNIIPSEGTFMNRGNNRIGSTYKKAVYREYTDKTFKMHKQRPEHYGLSGPPIKAQVGEHVEVVVYNRAFRPYSFLANGVSITKKNEGAVYKNDYHDIVPTGAVVQPGTVEVYRFDVTPDVGPTKYDTNCLTNIYHSAVDLSKDIYSGLFGPLVICKHGSLTHDGKQKGVDRELYVNWLVIDENLSWYIDQNINLFTQAPFTVDKKDRAFKLSNQIRAINGRSYGTLEGLRMCIGDKVAWHMYALGERFDHHHFAFDSNNFYSDGRMIDTASVFPGTGKTVLMVPDQAGRFSLRNQQLGYEFEGMFAYYDVMICTGHKLPSMMLPPRVIPKARGIVRRYFIGILEDKWDYCPVTIDPIKGGNLLDPESPGYQYVRDDAKFVGSVYLKARYLEFTDQSFLNIKPRNKEDEHLGILGPYIRGNAGDVIEIYLKNMASFPYSLVPRNVIFEDGSSISEAMPALPGKVVKYRYLIPKRSGPKPQEPNCVGTIYSSRVTPMNDTYSGLFGPFVICKPGVLDYHGRRTDKITKEFAVGFVIIDENKSLYKDYNFAAKAPARFNRSEEEFVKSNTYHTMNGLIYNNLKGLVFSEGEEVAFYIFGIGSTMGIHTAHFHGQLYIRRTSLALRRDVLEVYPGTYETVEMRGYNPGTWFFHCHVGTHTRAGMKAVYTVLPKHSKNIAGEARLKENHHMVTRYKGHGMMNTGKPLSHFHIT